MGGVSLDPGETGCLVLTSGYEESVYRQNGLAEYRGGMQPRYLVHSAKYLLNHPGEQTCELTDGIYIKYLGYLSTQS